MNNQLPPFDASSGSSSEFARNLPSEPALFKLRNDLILAIPPAFQQFWLQRDRVVRAPTPREKIPAVPLIGFNFFMPSFTGYTPANYKDEFHEDLVQVVSVEPISENSVQFDVDGAVNRLSGVALDKNSFKLLHGLKCFGDPRKNSETRYCVGLRFNNEPLIVNIMTQPYPKWVKSPLMQARYVSKRYSGVQIVWRANMKHFSKWREIDEQVWVFIDQWNIAK